MDKINIKKWKRTFKVIFTPLWFLCFWLVYLILSVVLAGITLKYISAKSKKNEIKAFELKQTRLASERLDLCTKTLPAKEKELEKLEKKLMKKSKKQTELTFEEFIAKNDKVIVLKNSIERLNKKISNYDRALAKEAPQDTTSEKDNKFIEKVETKIQDIKENIM